MKKIFLCSLILFCNSAFADVTYCKNTLFLMGCDDYESGTNFCSYCANDEGGCNKQTMDENNTATLPSKPSGYGVYCCVKANKVYVYDEWDIYDYLKTIDAYSDKGFGAEIEVLQDYGYFAFPDTEIAENQNGLCYNGVYSSCPDNKKCVNGVEQDCADNKYCEGGVEQDCPAGYKCSDGKKTSCNTPGKYCEGGVEQECPAGYYCTGDGLKRSCPAPSTSAAAADAKTDCYIDSNTDFCDGDDECFDLSSIDTINTKIFIKN